MRQKLHKVYIMHALMPRRNVLKAQQGGLKVLPTDQYANNPTHITLAFIYSKS